MSNKVINICGPKTEVPDGAFIINTTSRSTNWSKGLSPFILGPVKLYGKYVSKNVENGWQNAKVYKQHVGTDGWPNSDYFEWAERGWNNSWANRYPMGKGARPEYSYWDGEKLTYVEARKKIYIPLYSGAVRDTDAFKRLKQECKDNKEVWLWDFDGYDYGSLGLTFDQVMNDPNRKMGHAFVLAMLLASYL